MKKIINSEEVYNVLEELKFGTKILIRTTESRWVCPQCKIFIPNIKKEYSVCPRCKENLWSKSIFRFGHTESNPLVLFENTFCGFDLTMKDSITLDIDSFISLTINENKNITEYFIVDF
jgi:hypothetical protein